MKRLWTRWLVCGGLAIALVGILMSGQVQAETVSIEGVVVDPAGRPIPQVPVMVDGKIGSAATVTNSQGKFALFNMPSGEYSVSAAGSTKRVHIEVAKPWWYFSQETRPVFVGLTGSNPSIETPAVMDSVVTGRIWNIDIVSSTFEVDDMTFFTSQDHTIGVDLYGLEEGDKVRVHFSREAAIAGTSPILAMALERE